MQDQVTQAAVIGGILIANIGGLVASFVALKVAVAKLEMKVDLKFEATEKDINNLGAIYRATTNKKQE
jgi:hypothetical protein